VRKPSFRSMFLFVSTIVLMLTTAAVIGYNFYNVVENDLFEDVKTTADIHQIIRVWGFNICICILVSGICIIGWLSKMTKCLYAIKGRLEKT